MKHYSVLKDELINGLNINPDGIYVDCTLGYAGDSKEILKRLRRGFLFAFDQDEDAIHFSQTELSKIGSNFKIIYSNFVNLKEKLWEENVSEVDGIVYDLGLSSPQIDEAERGFSFMNDAPLDMRMDKSSKLDAKVVVNTYTEENLMETFFKYGEEKYSKSIAKGIIKARNEAPIETTLQLVEVIKHNVPTKYFYNNHPERQIFQAIRIEVNDELNVLSSSLIDAVSLLKPKGRLCVITFHSLEDRIVKQIFKKLSEVDNIYRGMPNIPDEYKAKIRLINKKPILPSEEELMVNSRSRSAKLRIIERV